MARWVAPLDPTCPEVERFNQEDPINDYIPGDVLRELTESFEHRHRKKCKRCQQYGADNIDIEY